jgi:hypothetical protein
MVIHIQGGKGRKDRDVMLRSSGISTARLEEDFGERKGGRMGLHLVARRGHADAFPR